MDMDFYKRIRFLFKDVSFNDSDAQSASPTVFNYDEKIKTMEDAASYLDGCDSFAALLLDDKVYNHTESSGDYGIIYDKNLHGSNESDGRILPHQNHSALNFLQNLGGFGLLANKVGSGKTYEAGIVLTELTCRGLVRSLLIISPKEIMSHWKETIERRFGLGIDKFYIIDGEEHSIPNSISSKESSQGEDIPCQPILLSFAAFQDQAEHHLDNSVLIGKQFDIIIVDEAHNLKDRDFELLKKLLYGEDKKHSTYCLMLTATPHDGNLNDMEKLWYFIRSKGRLDDKETHLAEYNAARKNAENISDFVINVKCDYFAKSDSFGKDLKTAWDKFLSDAQLKQIFKEAVSSNSKFEMLYIIDKFLKENEKYKPVVEQYIQETYKTLLSRIMIRDDSDANASRKGKNVVNLFLCPLKNEFFGFGVANCKIDENATVCFDNIAGDFTQGYYPYIKNENDSKHYIVNTNYYNTANYKKIVEQFIKNSPQNFRGGAAEYYKKIIESDYYYQSSKDKNKPSVDKHGQYNLLIPYASDSLTNKINIVKNILNKHSNERVIIFFDYENYDNKDEELPDNKIEYGIITKLQNALLEDNKLNLKLVNDTGNGRCLIPVNNSEFENDFNINDNCILLIKDKSFTEGVNLQKASVIINFQVTCDPVDMEQKVGRIFRQGQTKDVTIYSLADMHELEGYALAYFANIKMFSVNSGDSIILSGCNDNNLTMVQCNVCAKKKLIPTNEHKQMEKALNEISGPITKFGVNKDNGPQIVYVENSDDGLPITDEQLKKYKNNSLVCIHDDTSKNWGIMSPIASHIYISDDKKYKLTRGSGDKSQYLCPNNYDPHVLSRIIVSGDKNNEANRTWFCNSLCILSRCSKHRSLIDKNGTGGKCAAVELFKENNSYEKCLAACDNCEYAVECKKCGCKPSGLTEGVEKMLQQINKCIECAGSVENFDNCNLRAHKYVFDERFEQAELICSGIDKGCILKKQPLSKFKEHITYLWEAFKYDKTDDFCNILAAEASRVCEILRVISGRNYI